MNRKGSATVVAIIFAVVVLGGILYWGVFRWQTYQNEAYGFTFQYPRGMEVKEGGFGTFFNALYKASGKTPPTGESLPLTLQLIKKEKVAPVTPSSQAPCPECIPPDPNYPKSIIPSYSETLILNITAEHLQGISLSDANSPEELQKVEQEKCEHTRSAMDDRGRQLVELLGGACNVSLPTSFSTKGDVFGGARTNGGNAVILTNLPIPKTITFYRNNTLYTITSSPQTDEKLVLDIAKTFRFLNP